MSSLLLAMKLVVLIVISLVTANNATNYTSIVEKILVKLLQLNSPLDTMFDNEGWYGKIFYKVNETEFSYWDWLTFDNDSISGHKLSTGIHDLEFNLILPSPMIQGRLHTLENMEHQDNTTIVATSTRDIVLGVNTRVNDHLRQIIWKNMSFVSNMKSLWTSNFDCKLKVDPKTMCQKFNQYLDVEEDVWHYIGNQTGKIMAGLSFIKSY